LRGAEGIEEITQQTQDRTEDDQGVESNEPGFKKLPDAEVSHAIVIGKGDDETGEAKEEVYGEEAVADKIFAVVRLDYLHEMENDHCKGGNSTETVEEFEVFFCGHGEPQFRGFPIKKAAAEQRLCPVAPKGMAKRAGLVI
jgi:hypothetical protein